MPQTIYQQTALPTSASTVASASGVSWLNPSRITADDGSSSTLTFAVSGDTGAIIRGTGFSWQPLPASAVIVGLMVRVKGTAFSINGTVSLNIPGTVSQSTSTMDQSWGGYDYFWGLNSLSVSDLSGLIVSASANDISGGDGTASMDFIEATMFWQIELEQTPNPDIPTSFSYKVYSKDGFYLGDLPNVTSDFSFVQDINSAGSILKTVCGTTPFPTTTTEAILDNNGNPIQTESSLDILATQTYSPFLPGDHDGDAVFKNGNRLAVWMFNQWWPNGKLMFSGQMNRLDFSVGNEDQITVTTYSDGLDLENFYARGYPFSYTQDQFQSTQNTTVTIFNNGYDYTSYGQSFTTGPAAANVGQIELRIQGTADVSIQITDTAGNVLGSTTRSVVGSTYSVGTTFDYANLVPTEFSHPYQFRISVGAGQSIDMQMRTIDNYAGGSALRADFSGLSGGGTFNAIAGDLRFITRYGVPTTTTTYSSSDPVSEMATGIILDYNARGGRIVSRELIAAGYDLTYTFNSATINSALQKILELSPAGYYSFVDLGDSVIDIMPTSSTADFQVVVGRDIANLDLSLTVERVKNQLLFSGGEVSPGVNLFRIFQNQESSSNYGVRLAQKSDNRVTLDATASAIGASFLDENSSEIQETTVTLLNERVDITQYTPGKTLSFQNSGLFIDGLALQIVRREFRENSVKLTIGRLPVSQTAEVQRINREILNEQTVDNPSNPS